MQKRQRYLVPHELAGERLDRYLASATEGLSRTRLKQLIEERAVLVNGAPARASHHLRAGDRIDLTLREPAASAIEAEPIPLRIVYEDGDLAVIDKPAGLVVHPGAGHAGGTLVNALLHHLPDLSGIGGELRPGIVHRLDRGTSGLMVVAKHDRAHRALADQFRTRRVDKEYLALVWGVPVRPHGTIDRAVRRDPKHRRRMAVSAREEDGRPARTEFDVVQRFPELALLRVKILTGRTHQIRVHLASAGHPVVGDSLYARPRHTGRAAVEEALRRLDRPFLHAARLAFNQPITGERLVFESPVPEELEEVLRVLRGQP